MNKHNSNRLQNGIPAVMSSLRLSLCLNYSICLSHNHEKKRALRMIKAMLGDALDDFNNWEKSESDDIKR